MSQIVSKAFDASKKIIRSIFKGSPNLFTSADLNRQIEAIKYQLDLLDDKTGFVSDMDLSSATLLSSGNLSVLRVTPTFTALKYKGCDFKPASKFLQINISFKPAYLALFAKTSEVTYETDSSHEISGAKFADGTSQPAANQLVYTDEKLALIYADYTPNVAVDGELLGVIAMFQRTSRGTLVVKKNYFTGVTDALSFRTENTVVSSDTNSVGQITPGTSYNQAINILQNRLNRLKNNITSAWTSMIISSQGTYDVNFTAKFRITDGVLQIKTTSGELSYDTGEGSTAHIKLATFPTEVADKLDAYFNALDTTGAGFMGAEGYGGSFIPFGDVRPAIIIRRDTNNSLDYHKAILTAISLLVFNSGPLDVALGAYRWADLDITTKSVGTDNNALTPISGVGNLITGKGKLYIPAMFINIPLPGLNW